MPAPRPSRISPIPSVPRTSAPVKARFDTGVGSVVVVVVGNAKTPVVVVVASEVVLVDAGGTLVGGPCGSVVLDVVVLVDVVDTKVVVDDGTVVVVGRTVIVVTGKVVVGREVVVVGRTVVVVLCVVVVGLHVVVVTFLIVVVVLLCGGVTQANAIPGMHRAIPSVMKNATSFFT